MLSVVQQKNGAFKLMDGESTVARDLTNRKAWWMHDRKTRELTSRAESTSDWAFKQSTAWAKKEAAVRDADNNSDV